jgi:hypothetical protein
MAVISGFYTNFSWGMDYQAIFCAVSFLPNAQHSWLLKKLSRYVTAFYLTTESTESTEEN